MEHEIKYENENGKKYLAIELGEVPKNSSFEINMLEKNSIPGMLDMNVRNINNSYYAYYEVMSKQSLIDVYRYKKISWDDLENIIYGIDIMLKSMNEYMLDINCVMLEPQFVFMDIATGKTAFVYYSGDSSFDEKIKKLFEYILDNYDHMQERSKMVRMYEIYQKIAESEYDISRFAELLKEESDTDSVGEEWQTDSEEGVCEGIPEDNNTDVSKNCVGDNAAFKLGSKNVVKSGVKTGGIELSDIPKEKLEDEEEEKDKIMVRAAGIMKLIAIAAVIAGIVSLTAPGILPFDISVTTGVIVIITGALIFVGISRLPEELFVKVKRKEYEQAYILGEQNYTCDETEAADKKSDEKPYEKINDELCKESHEKLHNSEQHTMLLSDYVEKLRREKENIVLRCVDNPDGCEDINISATPCVIGSMEKYCDRIISNELISRIHICIVRLNKEWYVEDMNSTNGTYINDVKLLPNQRSLIRDKDYLKIATVEYQVEING